MFQKQKRSVVVSTAAYVLLASALILAWQFSNWLPSQLHNFHEPISRTSVVFAQQQSSELIQPVTLPSLEEKLDEAVEKFTTSGSHEYSIYIEDLSGTAISSHNAEQPLMAASLYKLFIANEALKMVDDGALVLNATVDGERGHSLRKCIEIMITVSDNECGVILQRITRASNTLLPQLKVQGFDHTDLRGFFPETSASDFGRLLKNLHDQNYLSAESINLLMSFLHDQQIDSRIPRNLPSSVDVAHKTGDLKGYIHDGGIISFEDQKYVLVIMAQPSDVHYTQTYAEMAEFSESIYKIFADPELVR